ncbi:LON peptidase N-terminal domain and RING finger protein 3-like [Homalodisca vitripennis]|uniref:LON peptidase N-terminal domain and RING finger protein 3-like n=1 Tax=Homalodisca vitripennis TaxID=197043 RepID=UPI001EEC0FAA|nr:LON peptidase N-terminal domain and RING finger protein 3-like [Homalodisca vitripennis]
MTELRHREGPEAVGNTEDFLERVADEGEGASAVLVTDEGFVKARPQTQEWMKHALRCRAWGVIPGNLKCSGCGGLLRRPVVTGCGHYYCEGCIQADARCSICEQPVTKISYDSRMASRVDRFLGK